MVHDRESPAPVVKLLQTTLLRTKALECVAGGCWLAGTRGESMSYQVTSVRFLVRETSPARLPSALGKKALEGDSRQYVRSPLCHVHMVLQDSDGNESFGCSADRLSVRWLDKRPGRTKARKLNELVGLIENAGELYRQGDRFDVPFERWHQFHAAIMQAGASVGQEQLTATFVSSLLERALSDAVCRIHGVGIHQALQDNLLGIDLERIDCELTGMDVRSLFRGEPRTRIEVRHTVGSFDPLTAEDVADDVVIRDALPVTLEECIDVYGLRCFKVKISGDPDHDLKRLERIWEIVPKAHEPIITLDANEAYEDLEAFEKMVTQLEESNLALFQHIAFIEQPLPRKLAFTEHAAEYIRRIAKKKPVIIDESDDSLDAFPRALAVGYTGTSHKNCKGVYKSIGRLARLQKLSEMGRETAFSGEDLQNLPIVPLHQDFAMVGSLRLRHCERNGHHYNRGLSMLSAADKRSVARHHQDLYTRYKGEWYLRIVEGAVETGSLHGIGFGVRDEPDWKSMQPLRQWLLHRYPE